MDHSDKDGGNYNFYTQDGAHLYNKPKPRVVLAQEEPVHYESKDIEEEEPMVITDAAFNR